MGLLFSLLGKYFDDEIAHEGDRDFKINPSFSREGKTITQSQIIYLIFNGFLPDQDDQDLTSVGMKILSKQIFVLQF